jgi:hypothetical protein
LCRLIETTGILFLPVSTSPGKTIHCRRWRQVDTAPNADPELAHIAINQTECGQVYYEGCGAIDQHNRHQQDGLDLEKKVQTMGWHNCAAHSIFGMCIIDAFDWPLVVKEEGTIMVVFGSSLKT